MWLGLGITVWILLSVLVGVVAGRFIRFVNPTDVEFDPDAPFFFDRDFVAPPAFKVIGGAQ